ALAHKAVRGDRRLGEGQRRILVDRGVALFEDVHGEVGVFGDSVGVIAAAFLDDGGAPCSDGSGDDGDDIEEVEGAAFRILAGNVLERLPAGPQLDLVADLGVACDRADLRIGAVRDEPGDGVVGDDRIGVDADVDILFDVR